MTFYVLQFRAKAMKSIDILICSKILHCLGQNCSKDVKLYTFHFQAEVILGVGAVGLPLEVEIGVPEVTVSIWTVPLVPVPTKRCHLMTEKAILYFFSLTRAHFHKYLEPPYKIESVP